MNCGGGGGEGDLPARNQVCTKAPFAPALLITQELLRSLKKALL